MTWAWRNRKGLYNVDNRSMPESCFPAKICFYLCWRENNRINTCTTLWTLRYHIIVSFTIIIINVCTIILSIHTLWPLKLGFKTNICNNPKAEIKNHNDVNLTLSYCYGMLNCYCPHDNSEARQGRKECWFGTEEICIVYLSLPLISSVTSDKALLSLWVF